MPEAVAPQHHEEAQSTSKYLELDATMGFSGNVKGGFVRHPTTGHQIYALGSTVVIKDPKDPRRQDFLHGHSNIITSMSVSESGRYIATGQQSYLGYPADVIVWDFQSRKLIQRFSLHKLLVQAVAFSPDEQYLVTLGGQDDNYLAIWDIVKGAVIAGATAAKDASRFNLCASFFKKDSLKLITAGNQTMRIWSFDPLQKKIHAEDCQMGTMKRVVNCLVPDENDEFMYCGTTTGDILQVGLKTLLFTKYGPPKNKDNFSLGVTAVKFSPEKNRLIAGCGDGTIAEVELDKLSIIRKTKVEGQVTSISCIDKKSFLACTSLSNIYNVSLESFENSLLISAHYSKVNDICFPDGCSDLFATASDSDIRIWNVHNHRSVLKISVNGASCECIVFKKDGSSLLSGWNDGKIRAFGPESGRIQFTIHDAHKGCVTALAVTSPINQDGEFRIISGGSDGQVRVWKASKDRQTLENAMKEHKENVTCIQLRQNERECVTSSVDGSSIVWDLIRGVRNQVMFSSTFFKAVSYFPDESQILTCGTDRKVTYWEAFDASLIREIDISEHGTLNGLVVTDDGKYFVVSGDKKIHIFLYEEGTRVAVGRGHSTEISKLRISPDSKHIVSVGTDGAIFIWKMPFAISQRLLPPTIAVSNGQSSH